MFLHNTASKLLETFCNKDFDRSVDKQVCYRHYALAIYQYVFFCQKKNIIPLYKRSLSAKHQQIVTNKSKT